MESIRSFPVHNGTGNLRVVHSRCTTGQVICVLIIRLQGARWFLAVRNLTSIKSRAPIWIAVFLVMNIAIGLVFAKSALGWLPIVASCLATVAVFRMEGVAMRSVLLVCTLLWLANNLLSGSIGGTVLEAIIAVVNAVTILSLIIERQRCVRLARQAVPIFG